MAKVLKKSFSVAKSGAEYAKSGAQHVKSGAQHVKSGAGKGVRKASTLIGAKKKDKKPAFKEAAVARLMKKAGVTEEEAISLLTDAKTRLGIGPLLYTKYRFFELSPLEQKTWAEEVKAIEAQRKERKKAEKENAVERVMLGTGASYEDALAMMESVRKQYGIGFEEFADGKYYQLPERIYPDLHAQWQKNEESAKARMDRFYLRRIRANTGWSRKKAERMLKKAERKYRITAAQYTNYHFYEVPEEQQSRRYLDVVKGEAEREQALFDKKMQQFSRVVMRTGWSLAQASQAMRDTSERTGVLYADYIGQKLYRLDPEQQKAHIERVREERKETAAEDLEDCIAAIMEATGLDHQAADKQYRDAKKRLGIGPRIYRRYRFFDIPEEEQDARYKEILAQLAGRTEVQIEDNDSYLDEIVQASGWTIEEARQKIIAAEKRSGSSWKDFYAFKFWEIPESEQKEYFTNDMRQALSDHFDDLRNRDIFVNKENFMTKFAAYTGRPWAVSTQLDASSFAETFAGCGKVLYKPSNNGNSGSGIEVFDMAEGAEAVFAKIAELPRGLVEGYLVQNEEMNRLYPDAVDTMRVASVCWDDEETGENHMDIAYTVLRIGSGGSNVDNFTTGGMVASIDMATGEVVTDAVDVDGKAYPVHPDTGVTIRGFKVPYYQEALALVREAGRGICGYIGWDVAITENGPVLIEANIDPGNRLLQMPFVPEKKGMAHVMDKYLKLAGFDRDSDSEERDFGMKATDGVPVYNKMKDMCEKYGISEEEYFAQKYYLLSAMSIDRLFTNPSINARIRYVAEKYDAPKGEVYAKAIWAYRWYKVPLYAFSSKDLYPETDEAPFRECRRSIDKTRNERIHELMDITGWDLPTMRQYIRDIWNKFGVDMLFIKDHELFKHNDAEIQKIVDDDREDTEKRRKKILDYTGWDEFQLEWHRNECRSRYGIFELATYDNLDCYMLPFEVLDTFGVPGDGIKLGKKYNTIPTDILDDKTKFDPVFKEFLGRKFWVNRDTSIEEFREFVDGLDAVFCKPINLLGGHGSYRYDVTDDIEGMYEYFMNEPKMLIEEVPKQHHLISAIYPNCIDSMRVTTILDNDKFYPFATWIKFGGNGSVMDGRIGGGCFAAVDPKTGIVCTKAIDRDNVRHANHYDTGAQILGFQIPYWDQVLELCERALRHVDGLNFVGWDVAVTEDGPIIIEGNSKPALGDHQLLYGETHEGKKWEYERFLPKDGEI